MMTTLGGLLLAAGAVLLVIAAWGVIVLPDALGSTSSPPWTPE